MDTSRTDFWVGLGVALIFGFLPFTGLPVTPLIATSGMAIGAALMLWPLAKRKLRSRFEGDAGIDTAVALRTDTEIAPEVAHTQQTLVERYFWRAFVNAPGAPTQNELLILLRSRYPKWTSKTYLRRSLVCRTQSLDDSLAELVEVSCLIGFCGLFFKLSLYGVEKAEERVRRYQF